MFGKNITLFTAILLTISIVGNGWADDEYIYIDRTDPNSIEIDGAAVNIDEGFEIMIPGAPRIDYKIVKLVLPPGKEISDFSIETENPIVIGTAHLDYIKGDIKTGFYPDEIADAPDPEIFASDKIYPEKRIEILDKGNWGEINLITLAVYPVGYKPLSKEVLLFPEITIKFHLEPFLPNPYLRSRNDRIAFKTLGRMVHNKMDLLAVAGSPPVVGLPKVTSGIPSPEYLIITSGAIAPGFYPFLEWKNQKGMPTDLMLIEDILAIFAGSDPAEQLRNYLIQAYNDGVRWVLLGGDEDVVPIRYLYPGNVTGYIPELGLQQLSDMYFSDLTGEWDVDGDGVWGESYHDSPDIYPELYVGRVPVRNREQAQIWGAKAIKYEKNPGNGDASYLTKALFIAADQMRDYEQHYVLAGLLPGNFTYDVNRLEEMPSGGAPSPTGPFGDEVINIMNEGWGFISNLNHGSPEWYASKSNNYNRYGWSGVWGTIVPDWNRCGGLIQLTAYDQPAVHYSISCDLGAYDFDKGILSPNPYATTFTYAEAYLFEPGGGVAFLGNSRWGWVSSSYIMERKFIEHIFNDSTSRMSEAEALSKIDYPNYRDIGYGHTLFGDPEMRLWTAVQGDLAIEGPRRLQLGQPIEVTYSVYIGTDPVPGAKVCLYLPGHAFDIDIADENGEVSFQIVPEFDGVATVTATKQNFIPAQLELVIGSPAGAEDEIIIPKSARIYQNYPNPFNSSTVIEFELPRDAFVDLDIYDIGGRLVKRLASQHYPAGEYSIVWDGSNGDHEKVASGIYLFRFSSGNKVEIKQMTLLK
ncbi:MAG: T9SS type A sorting domain-containing protein [Candidatus Zixiibacteriota bacterium]|nr:MAG: T9SS type A sorting domain-containing protein [candidate division Zixibacteria bacterium]